MAKKKEEQKVDILENPEVLAETLQSAENWVEQHSKLLIAVTSVLLIVVGGYFGYRYYVNDQDQQAQIQMFQAIYYFEADSLNLALNGDGNNLGLLEIIDEFGMTPAGKLANYYAGMCYLKKKQYEAAILHLEDFHADDLLVQARCYSLLGDAYMDQGQYKEAASYYDKAAGYKPNKFFTPSYLMKAGLAYEKLNDKERAIEAYKTIIEKYSDSQEVQNAQKYKAKLEPNS